MSSRAIAAAPVATTLTAVLVGARISGLWWKKYRIANAGGPSQREKRCPLCLITKPADQFSFSSRTRGGLAGYCKPCVARKVKQHIYGITPAEQADMLRSQGNACAICRVHISFDGSAKIDHCHASGVIRGMLCENCNIGVGHFKDDPERLRAAAVYLEQKKR